MSNTRVKAGQLVSGLIGMLCPVPIIGELFLAGFFYSILKDTSLGESNIANIGISLSGTALTRLNFYQPFYLPAIDFINQ